MSDFGDFENDDAFDTAPPDAEQVARKYASYSGVDWDGLTPQQRSTRIERFVKLLAWLRRQGGIE